MQTEGFLSEMRSLLGWGGQLKTVNYSVRPSYKQPKPGAAATIDGYTATNVVEITIDDLSQVAKVIDTAVGCFSPRKTILKKAL
jgi:uncharacterized protein YggE